MARRKRDLRASTRTTPPGTAAFVIGHASVHAQDACTQVIGSVTVTLTTIAFSKLRWTNHTCTDPMTVAVSEVMHRGLSGTIKYAIRGNELMLYGRRAAYSSTHRAAFFTQPDHFLPNSSPAQRYSL